MYHRNRNNSFVCRFKCYYFGAATLAAIGVALYRCTYHYILYNYYTFLCIFLHTSRDCVICNIERNAVKMRSDQKTAGKIMKNSSICFFFVVKMCKNLMPNILTNINLTNITNWIKIITKWNV